MMSINSINYKALITAASLYSAGIAGIFIVDWTQLSIGFYLFFVGYTFFGMMGSTLGLHRYFCHKSFETSFGFKVILFLGGSSVFVGSFAEWIHDHIDHHRYLNTEKDHTNRNQGFFHSHFAWAFQDKPVVYGYLLKDQFLSHIHRFHLQYSLVTAIILPLLIGLYFTTLLNSFLLLVCLRLTLQQNTIFSLGSLCHKKTGDGPSLSLNNLWLALPTLGDSYQQSHHDYPRDFRHGRNWYSFDPNKWLILLLSYLKIVKKLQTCEEKRNITFAYKKTKVS